MNLLKSYAALVGAETEYAHFNAMRTSATSDVSRIELSKCGDVSVLLEPDKPANPYYNRAVLPVEIGEDGDAVTMVSQVPKECQAVEVLVTQQSETVSSALLAAGFVPGSSLCYLMATPKQAALVDHDIVRLTPDRSDQFLDLIERSGAKFPDGARELKGDYYCTDAFRCYVGFTAEGEPAAMATMYVSEKTNSGFFANTFTFPEFRCQGFHSALLAARLNEVVELGLDCAFTDVEPATQSHQNCERLGFRLLTANAIWTRTEGQP